MFKDPYKTETDAQGRVWCWRKKNGVTGSKVLLNDPNYKPDWSAARSDEVALVNSFDNDDKWIGISNGVTITIVLGIFMSVVIVAVEAIF